MTALNLNNQPLNGYEGKTINAGITLNFAEDFTPQVLQGMQAAGVQAIRNADMINLSVQGHAALIEAAFGYGVTAVLPKVPITDPNAGWSVCGSYNPWRQRQDARTRRIGLESAGKDNQPTILNFGHPIAAPVMEKTAAYFGLTSDEINVITVKVQMDVKGDLYTQFAAICDQAGIGNWETANIIAVNPATMGLAGLGILAEIHGRRGSFPPVLCIREKVRGEGFDLAEVLNLMQATEDGRQWAAAEEAAPPTVKVSGKNVPQEFLAKLAELAKKHGVKFAG